MTGATNTQKTVLISLHEGWGLRYVSEFGWCLFQPGRRRPFAKVKDKTVKVMTELSWLTPGTMLNGIGYRPAKDLTPLGKKYALQLEREEWANTEWEPDDGSIDIPAPIPFRKAA